MSRLDGRMIQVETDGDGNPTAFTLPGGTLCQKVINYISYWREWIGILEGEPERDIWWVQTEGGICEIHCLRYLTTDKPDKQAASRESMWLIHAWED